MSPPSALQNATIFSASAPSLGSSAAQSFEDESYKKLKSFVGQI